MKEKRLSTLQQKGLVVEGIYRDVRVVKVCNESDQWTDLTVIPRVRMLEGKKVTIFDPKKPSRK